MSSPPTPHRARRRQKTKHASCMFTEHQARSQTRRARAALCLGRALGQAMPSPPAARDRRSMCGLGRSGHVERREGPGGTAAVRGARPARQRRPQARRPPGAAPAAGALCRLVMAPAIRCGHCTRPGGRLGAWGARRDSCCRRGPAPARALMCSLRARGRRRQWPAGPTRWHSPARRRSASFWPTAVRRRPRPPSLVKQRHAAPRAARRHYGLQRGAGVKLIAELLLLVSQRPGGRAARGRLAALALGRTPACAGAWWHPGTWSARSPRCLPAPAHDWDHRIDQERLFFGA